MKKLSFMAAIVGITMSATSAQALSISFATGGAASNLGETTLLETFEGFAVGDLVGGGNKIFNSTVSGQAETPAFGSSGNYLAVQGNNTSTFTGTLFPATGVKILSFVIGSLDTYNRVTLFLQNAGTITLDGIQIVAPFGTSAGGSPTSAMDNGRVFYDAQSDVITGFALTSVGSNAFEIDNISIAAPEPATWGMLILAAGMAGAGLRRRRLSSLA